MLPEMNANMNVSCCTYKISDKKRGEGIVSVTLQFSSAKPTTEMHSCSTIGNSTGKGRKEREAGKQPYTLLI